MKTLFFFLFFPMFAVAQKSYYISCGGNDDFNGMSPATAWKSIAHLNSLFNSIAPGDSVLFKCNESFYGSIVINKSGATNAAIVISSYGKGAKPVITGFSNLSNFSKVSQGIYQALAKGVKYNVNMLTINGVPQRVGRYPDYEPVSGGYLSYDAFKENTGITAGGLSAADWIGSEVVIRKDGYIIETDSVTNQSGGEINYISHRGSINPRNDGPGLKAAQKPQVVGAGMFIQRNIKTLTEFGEWYFSAADNKMNIFFGNKIPSSFEVKVSTIDTLLNINNNSFIEISNISLEGAGMAAIYFADTKNITIKNCNISCSGQKAIFGWNSSNIIAANNHITYSLCNAIDITGRHSFNCSVINNIISNTGIYAGMSSNHSDMDAKGIYVSVKQNAVIRKNRIDSTGYNAIQFQGDDITVDSNFINYFCFVKDDGGGIYTFNNVNGSGRKICNNIILNGIGAPAGNRGTVHAEGIYCDGETAGVDVSNNSIANVINRGIYLNDPTNVTVLNNTVYNAFGWCINKHFDGNIRNAVLKNNQFFYGPKPYNNDQTSFIGGIGNTSTFPSFPTLQPYFKNMGIIDSNYYHIPVDNVFFWYFSFDSDKKTISYERDKTFEYWRNFSGQDAHSTRLKTQPLSEQFFIYNDGDVAKSYNLKQGKYQDVKGKVYSDHVLVPAWSSIILLKIKAG